MQRVSLSQWPASNTAHSHPATTQQISHHRSGVSFVHDIAVDHKSNHIFIAGEYSTADHRLVRMPHRLLAVSDLRAMWLR